MNKNENDAEHSNTVDENNLEIKEKIIDAKKKIMMHDDLKKRIHEQFMNLDDRICSKGDKLGGFSLEL